MLMSLPSSRDLERRPRQLQAAASISRTRPCSASAASSGAAAVARASLAPSISRVLPPGTVRSQQAS